MSYSSFVDVNFAIISVSWQHFRLICQDARLCGVVALIYKVLNVGEVALTVHMIRPACKRIQLQLPEVGRLFGSNKTVNYQTGDNTTLWYSGKKFNIMNNSSRAPRYASPTDLLPDIV